MVDARDLKPLAAHEYTHNSCKISASSPVEIAANPAHLQNKNGKEFSAEWPPDIPQMRRAALAGSPVSQSLIRVEDLTEAVAEFQAQKLRKLYFFCRATACTIATLAYGVCR